MLYELIEAQQQHCCFEFHSFILQSFHLHDIMKRKQFTPPPPSNFLVQNIERIERLINELCGIVKGTANFNNRDDMNEWMEQKTVNFIVMLTKLTARKSVPVRPLHALNSCKVLSILSITWIFCVYSSPTGEVFIQVRCSAISVNKFHYTQAACPWGIHTLDVQIIRIVLMHC